MSPEAINREEIDRRLDRLRQEYGSVHVENAYERVPPEEFESWVEETEEYDYIGGAYCVIRRPAEAAPDLTASMPDEAAADGERVLFMMGRGATDWGFPGGGVEDGETFEEAAVREVEEEVSIDCEVTDLLHVHRIVGVCEGTAREGHLAYVFFEADYVGGTVAIQGGELNGACWFRTAPDDLHPFVEDHADSWV